MVAAPTRKIKSIHATNLTSIPSKFSAASLTLPKPLSNAFTADANTVDRDARGRAEQNLKFAEITAAVSDILLDDETSPSNSLVSSTASDIVGPAKTTKKAIESKKTVVGDDDEKDIDEISPIFDATTPLSQGTPTHASHSFSFSDGDDGRDFLIDDEIADQPVLCFSDKNHGSPSVLESPTKRISPFLTMNILHFQHQTHNCIQSLTQPLSSMAARQPNLQRT